MAYGCRVAAVKNSPSMSCLRKGVNGGSVLYAPLAQRDVRVDGVAATYIIAACAPLPLC